MKYGVLATMLFHAEWNLMAYMLEGVIITDFWFDLAFFFIIHILMLFIFLGTLLVLESIMNRKLYPKLIKSIVIEVYLLSGIFLVFEKQFLEIFISIGSYDYSLVQNSSLLLMMVFIVHLMYIVLTKLSESGSETYMGVKVLIPQYCGGCGNPRGRENYCGNCGVRLT